MARPLRVEFAGAFYHVMNRGNAGETLFKSKKDRERFVKCLETAVERFSLKIQRGRGSNLLLTHLSSSFIRSIVWTWRTSHEIPRQMWPIHLNSSSLLLRWKAGQLHAFRLFISGSLSHSSCASNKTRFLEPKIWKYLHVIIIHFCSICTFVYALFCFMTEKKVERSL
jgi:hypothetical protein